MPVLRADCPNPADPTSGLRLMSNGQIVPYGNAVAPSDWQVPDSWTDHSAWDMQIIEHLTPSGYILSDPGTVHDFGGVTPAVGYQNTGQLHVWRRISMNPAGNGQGYEWNCRGSAFRFGPSLPPLIGGPLDLAGDVNRAGGIDWGADILADVAFDWATKRWVILNFHGNVVSNPFTLTMNSPVRPLSDDIMYRALAMRNPAFPPGQTDGWIIRRDGAPFGFDGAEYIVPIGPFPNLDVVRDATVISDGQAGRPLIIQLATTQGTLKNIVASSPPTVVGRTSPFATGSTVSTTTRPTFSFDFTDPDGDAMASAEIKLFTSAQYGAGGFDPSTSAALGHWVITDPLTFSQQADFDVPNGSYKVYFRATDTAGDVSTWVSQAFSVSVNPPSAPTITATPDSATWRTTVTATAAVGTATGSFAAIEYSDDAGTTWQAVVGADPPILYPTSGPKTVTVSDWQAPFNQTRSYRARTITPDGLVTSAASSTASAVLQSGQWVLGIAATGEQAAVEVVPPFEYTEPSGGTALAPIGRTTAVVVRTTQAAKRLNLTLRAWDRAQFDELGAILGSRQALHLRDPYRRSLFLGVVDDRQVAMLEVQPNPFEQTEFGYAHTITMAATEVDRP